MATVWLWTHDGGSWSDPAVWWVAEMDVGASMRHQAPRDVRPADRAPGHADTVVFGSNDFGFGGPSGPLTGGGAAAAVYTAVDWGAVELRGDGDPLTTDVYRFGEVHLEDRHLLLQEAVLVAGEVTVDGTSRLSLAEAGVARDSLMRPYSAMVTTLRLDGHAGAPLPPQLELGANVLQVGVFDNANGDRNSVGGTGAILPISGRNEPPPQQPPPEEPPVGQPPPPFDWGAASARVEAYHAATGRWVAFEDIPADWTPDTPMPPPAPQYPAGFWYDLAAVVCANYVATGQWFVD